MAIHFEKHPVETAAREAAAALRQSIQPIEEACGVLGRIALLHFESADVAADFASQLRELARNIRTRNQTEGATARSLLAGTRELEKNARALATSKI